jgi:hypothetical protein
MQFVKMFNALAVFVATYIEDHAVYNNMLSDATCPWSVDYLTKAFAFYMSLHGDDDLYATSYFESEGYITSFKNVKLNQHILLETICQDLREALESCRHVSLTQN